MDQTIKDQITAFVESVEAAENRIPDFENRAEEITEQVQRREELSSEIADLQQQRVPLEAELSSIKPAYMDALYEQNLPLQKKLQTRKKAIEKELSKLDQGIEQKREELVPVDGLADLHADLDSFKGPDVFAFLRSIDLPLHRELNGIESKVQSIGRTLPYDYDAEVYDTARREVDDRYRRRQEAAEREERRVTTASKETQRILAIRDREAAIGRPQDDRITSTVSDRAQLVDD